MTSVAPAITLTQAMTAPELFGKIFRSPTFWPWRVVAKLVDNLPLTEPREIALFQNATGRSYNRQARREQQRLLRRFIILVGRRGGKDRFLSAVAVWRCISYDWKRLISPGEQAVVILLGRDKKQAAILRRYCQGLLQAEHLKPEVVRSTGDVIEFKNGSSLEISTNDASLVRGRSAIAILGSEASHWKYEDTSSSSDEEVVSAAEPSMAMCPDGGLLMLGSSVFRKRGYMYRKYKELHGSPDSGDICWFATSRVMNPLLRQAVVDAALTNDPLKAAAEFENEFRDDSSDFCSLEVLEANTDTGVWERAPLQGVSHVAYVDMALGTGKDSATLGIAHCKYETNEVWLDAVRERRPPFVPAQIVAEFAELMKFYGVYECHGDRVGGGFHSDELLRNGIVFVPSEWTTSEVYQRCLPILLARRAHLLDSAVLRQQISSLERRVTVARHETISHPQVASAHDDLAAAACGALVLASSRLAYDPVGWVADELNPQQDTGSYQAQKLHGFLETLAACGAYGMGSRQINWQDYPRQINWNRRR
jgi:hypothetical protein